MKSRIFQPENGERQNFGTYVIARLATCMVSEHEFATAALA